MIKFKVASKGGRWIYGFDTLESACEYANNVFRRTGNIVAVERYWGR